MLANALSVKQAFTANTRALLGQVVGVLLALTAPKDQLPQLLVLQDIIALRDLQNLQPVLPAHFQMSLELQDQKTVFLVFLAIIALM